MTLKEEFELLRGEPIKLRTPVEQVPCNETSDVERLCRNPVVSVYMVTYNHEPYIAQAIEGVMMQQTDFEFELVIGEDASQDRTRETCFEYCRRYPDKIRVLWSEENVTRPYGGNGPRVMARCRGEFIAFCEGDDYWTDPLKLQKQVDVMRANPSVGLCFANASVLEQCTGRISTGWGTMGVKTGVIPGMEFFNARARIMTCTVLLRRALLVTAQERYEIFGWRLFLGDLVTWRAIALQSDFFCHDSTVAVYRNHAGGVTKQNPGRVDRDACLVDLYYARATGLVSFDRQAALMEELYLRRCRWIACGHCAERWRLIGEMLRVPALSAYARGVRAKAILLCVAFRINPYRLINAMGSLHRCIRKVLPKRK